MPDLPKVFISSTSADLKHSREIVIRALLRGQTHMPVEQTDFTPTHKTVREMLREIIEGCDAMIHIIGKRYGMEEPAKPGQQRMSYTQMEYEIAQELNLPIYTFICDDDFDYTSCEPETVEKQELQRAYRKQFVASETRVFTWIKKSYQLDSLVTEAKLKIFGREDVFKRQRELVKDLAWAYDEKKRTYPKTVSDKVIWEDTLKGKARQEGITVEQVRKEIAAFIATVESQKNAARVDWDDLSRVDFLKKRDQMPEKKWWELVLAALGRQRKKIALAAAGACVLAALAWAGYHFGVPTPARENEKAAAPKVEGAIVPTTSKQEVKPPKIDESKTSETSQSKQSTSSVVKEDQKPAVRPIVQPKEYHNDVAEEGVIAFAPAGTLTIKPTSGDEIKAILNTVTGFPVSFYQNGIQKELTLDSFIRVEFSYKNNGETVTIRTYDDKNTETIVLENYGSPSSMGTISFMTDKGTCYLPLDSVEWMAKDEKASPDMSKDVRHVYIRSGAMVYKVPQQLLKYKYEESSGETSVVKSWRTTNYFGIPYSHSDIFSMGLLKYIRVFKEAEGFNKTKNSIYVNVYYENGTMLSTSLLCDGYRNSSLVAPTVLGEISLAISNLDEIFFGTYDINFAKSVSSDAWKGSTIPCFLNGVATVHRKSGGVLLLALNSLAVVNGKYIIHPSPYAPAPAHYFGIVSQISNMISSNRNALPLFFSDMKNLSFNKRDDIFFINYILNTGETGQKLMRNKEYGDYWIEGLSENGVEKISFFDIEKITFDKSSKMDISRFKKAIVVSKQGYVFETFQTTLYFSYVPHNDLWGTTYYWNQQMIKTKGGPSITYDKIKKIDFLPAKNDEGTTRYPAKIILRSGGALQIDLDISGITSLRFLTSLGMFSYDLSNDVQSIELLD